MSLPRFNPTRDGNEKEIIQCFKLRGFSVERLNTPLDLLIGYNKRNYLVEVKMPKGKLNDNQVEFTERWKGQWVIISSVEQANRFANQVINNRNRN